ncbi:MAG: TonB-dependent receptor [Coprobacter sp.]|nr:TonB-dependent receptor [Coprobacter sp.]
MSLSFNKRIWIGFLAVFTLFTAEAQSLCTLSGQVTDTQGRALSAATVAVEGTQKKGICDDSGRYTISLDKGRHTLSVYLLGYKRIRRTIDITADKVQNFVLEEEAVSVETVTVYGKSNVRQLQESAYQVTALDIKSITSSVSNLNDLVNRTTGIKIREEGGVGSDFDLSINGLSGNSVRYFIDGVPLDSKGADIKLNNLPVNLIDHIEIYKGVVPAHLGTDALGGAVNIITTRKKNHYIDASYGTGSFHTHIADLNAQWVESRTGLVFRPAFGINYSRNDYMMKGVEEWNPEVRKYLPVNRRRFHDGYFSLLGQFEIGVSDKRWADDFFLSGSYSKVDKELQTGAMQNKVYGAATRNSQAWNVSARYAKRWNRWNIGLSASHTWDNSCTTDTAYRIYSWDGNFISSSRNEITGRARSMREYNRPLTTVRLNAGYDINPHHNLGLNYTYTRTGNGRYDKVDDTFEPTRDALTKMILGLHYSQRFLSNRMENTLFVKDYVNMAEIEQSDMSVITGAKEAESHSVRNYFGGGAALKYTFWDPLSVKASYEHSIRLPLARELLGNGTTIYPNLLLKPENSDNVNLTLFGTVPITSEHLLLYEVGGFLRYVNDFIQASVSEKEGTMQYENIPAIHIKGLDAEMQYRWRNALYASFNISYSDARDQRKYKTDGKPSATYLNRVPNRPWFYCNAEAGYTFRFKNEQALRLSYNWSWVHWFYLSWEAYGAEKSKSRIPEQNVSGASITYSLKNQRYSLSLECSNLFDATVYDNYMLQKPGRAFFAKARIFID